MLSKGDGHPLAASQFRTDSGYNTRRARVAKLVDARDLKN